MRRPAISAMSSRMCCVRFVGSCGLKCFAGLFRSLHRLCAGLLDKTLKLEMWDWNKDGDHTLVGSIYTTTRSLVNDKTAMLVRKTRDLL